MKNILPLILTLLCLVSISLTARIFKSAIIDLDSSEATEFSSQAATWTLSNAICPTCDHSYNTTSACFSGTTYNILGGPNSLGPAGASAKNQYFTKEYPPVEKFPTWVVLQFDFYLMASSSLNTALTGVVDFTINGKSQAGYSWGIGQCSANTVDSQGFTITALNKYGASYRYNLTGIADGSSFVIKFTNLQNYPSSQRSFGFRNLKAYMFRNASQFSDINFPCNYNFYWDDDEGCLPCHPFCKVCTGPTHNECTSCNYPNFKYTNTTCLDTCVVPFTPTLTSTSNTCKKTCTIATSPYYLQEINRCSATCNSPLTLVNSDGLCLLPCGASNYQYPDGSCQVDCPAPLKTGTTYSGYIKTCSTTCANYLYPNNSCIAECKYPMKTENVTGIKYCKNPCPNANDYWYADNTCAAVCELPLIIETISGVKYCKKPCPDVANPYLYPDKSCQAACESPLEIETTAGVLICKNPCSGHLAPDNSCVVNCEPPLEIKTTAGVSYCKNSCSGYLYPDDSCVSECDSPLEIKTMAGVSYCKNSCNGYLYLDNSCLSACEPPLEIKNVAGIQYCKTSCSDYLYPDHSCFAKCDSPLLSDQVGGIKSCKSSCTDVNYFFYPDNSCLANCEIPLTAEETGGIPFCKNSCSGYLYPDNSCVAACVAPLLTETTAGVPYCRSPCSDANNYLYPDDSCFGACLSPLVADQVGGIQFCKASCPNTNDYLYPDDSCLVKCEPPLVIESVGGISYCENPCRGYLYPDNSCLTNCEFPMIIKNIAGVQYCKNPCNNFIYPDGSCLTTCESPLKAENTAGVEYCKSPCSDDYLYSDGSCDDACPVPLSEKTEHDVKYCYNPCKESDSYLASNQLCQATCPSPSIIKTELLAKFCVFPCENLNDYYFEETGECQATCKSPNTAIESPLPKICKPPKGKPIVEEPKPTSPSKEEDPEPKEEDESVEKITKTQNKANTVLSAGVFAFTILNPLDSTLSLIGSFSKMLQYIKYMKINYPEKVQIMLKQQNDGFQDFPNKMAPSLLKEFPNHELPEKFEFYSTSSSFFVNFWSTFFKLSVILFFTFLVLVIAQQRKKSSKPIDGPLKILVECLKWNLFLTFFCSNIADVVLFTALEMRTLHLNNAAALLSFLLCLAVNIGSLYVVYKILDITWDIRKSKKKVTPLEGEPKIHPEPETKWVSFQTLFAPYQDRWYYQHIFLFIFLVRVCLFSGMLGYLFEYPGFQASAFVVFGVLMLVFLIVKRPIKDRVSLIMEIIFELVLLPFNLCVLILAIMDEKGIENIDQRNRLGDVMIYISLIAPFLAIAMTATKAFLIGRGFYKEMKAQKSNRVKKICPEVALDATQEIFPNNTTRILRGSSIVDKNLWSNSQKIDDLEEEPSPTPSPDRSLISNNRIQRISVLVEKSRQARAHFRSTLAFPENMATSSPEVSPTRDSASHTRDSVSQISKSITPPENTRSRFFARQQQRGNTHINQNL